MAEPRASHVFVDHTGEVEIELRAPSLAELFVEAGRALAELMLGQAEPPAAPVRESLALGASSVEALLVKWLNELVFRSETHKAVFTGFDVRLRDLELAAEIRGVPDPVLKTAVKAATYHRLELRQKDGQWLVSVVLDV